jgi:hypothetical protein
MSDVHEAAATILKTITKTVSDIGVCYDRAPGATLGLMEPYEVAAAYLSEHDPTEITLEWLGSFGIGRGQWVAKTLWNYTFEFGDDLVVTFATGGWMSVSFGANAIEWPVAITTRGQFRTVFRLLGIPALEQPAPVEKD